MHAQRGGNVGQIVHETMERSPRKRKVDKRAAKKNRALLAGAHKIKKTQEMKVAILRDELDGAVAAPVSRFTRRADKHYDEQSFRLHSAVSRVADAAASISGTTRWANIGEGGNLYIVNEGDTSEYNFGLVAAQPMVAPSQEWWRAARGQRLGVGWSDGEGTHGLSADCLRSIVRYDGEMLCEVELKRRREAGQHELAHVKLSRFMNGNEMLIEDFNHYAIDGSTERKKILHWYVRSRGKPNRSVHLARCHPGCLSQSSGKPTMRPVIDGPRMFLVPLRDINVGERVTHKYNTDPLEARAACLRQSRA